jgi:hypothetical protein
MVIKKPRATRSEDQREEDRAKSTAWLASADDGPEYFVNLPE